MDADGKSKLTQAGVCVVCAVMVSGYGRSLEGTEFGGGRLTGLLLDMKDVGALLFALALLLTFLYRRIAASIALTACLLSLPLYLYFTNPGPFQRIFSGERWSVPLQATFVWDSWTIAGIVMLAITAYVGIRGLRRMEIKDLGKLRKGLD
jgi:hypothetical protein